MSEYKYKGQLSTLADMYLNTGNHEPLLEIEHVYAQAAKADEYEAKAKAWDEVRHIMDYHYPDKEDRQGVRGYQNPKVALKNIGDVIEDYESGDHS